MQNINLYILNAGKRLTPYIDIIHQAYEEVLLEVYTRLPLSDIDIVITDDPEGTISEIGVGGFAANPHLLYISIDPKHPDLKNTLTHNVKSTLAHELHHIIRFRTWWWPWTLLESFVCEGLADHFDMEVNGTDPKPWSKSLTDEEVQRYLEKAQPELMNTEFDKDAWFFGSKESEIPKWAGYAIGFNLVDSYIKKTGKTAGELVDLDAREFAIEITA